MSLSDAGLVIAGNAVDTAITHMQFHTASPGASGTTASAGARVAVNGTVDADGDITWTGVAFTGLGASVAAWGVTYWTALTGGTYLGQNARTGGDTNANAAGEYTFTSIAENNT